MKIKKLYIDAYKNLVNCEIHPSDLHAITGINGSGKSNLLEVFQFIAALITRDDTFRDNLLLNGHCPSGSEWFPIPPDESSIISPFKFHLECEITVDKNIFIIKYSLEIAEAIMGEGGPYDLNGQGIINSELLEIKQMGTPGPMKTLLKRNSDGEVTIHPELSTRSNPIHFKTKKNMSAIQALEVREADDFITKYPILNQFKTGLISSVVVKIDPELITAITKSISNNKLRPRSPGTPLNSFSLYEAIESIRNDDEYWGDYNYWLKTLCNIDEIDVFKTPSKDENSKLGEHKSILITREDRLLIPSELSTGNIVLLSLVTALFSFLKTSGVIIFEEPETYIHPKAMIDLIRLLRNISEIKTIVFSTHSPVALNSMKSNEVTLMFSIGDGRYTSKAVNEIKEASDAISRGYLSFGDLLQSNFMTE